MSVNFTHGTRITSPPLVAWVNFTYICSLRSRYAKGWVAHSVPLRVTTLGLDTPRANPRQTVLGVLGSPREIIFTEVTHMHSTYRQYLNGWHEPLPSLRVGVVGTRESGPDAYTRVKYILDIYRHERACVIVTGGARGYDQLGMRYAEEHGLPCDVYYPLWNEYGKRAGFLRNIDIVENSDIIFAWPGIGGKGTQHTVNIAHERGVDIIIEYVERSV